MTDPIIGKEQFLIQHNKLSPLHLQTTLAMLTRFQGERKPLLKDREWSFKLRIPFMTWLSSLPLEKEKHIITLHKDGYQNYPETKF